MIRTQADQPRLRTEDNEVNEAEERELEQNVKKFFFTFCSNDILGYLGHLKRREARV